METHNSSELSPEALNMLFDGQIYVIRDKEEPVAFDYSGGNNRYLLLVNEEKDHPFISASNEKFLQEMLKNGINYSLEDIALINTSKTSTKDFNSLCTYFGCNQIIIWGADPAKIGISEQAELYKPFTKNGKVIIFADKLDKISQDINLKRQLWASLQQVFNVNKK